jgi:hypothetical protein
VKMNDGKRWSAPKKDHACCASQGINRFIAVIRDSGSKGLELRLALKDIGCDVERASWTDRQG